MLAATQEVPKPESAITRVLRVLRALVVGAGATLTDLGTMILCVRALHLNADLSRSLALVAGCVVLFFGYRSFAFRVQAGSITRQAVLFLVSEVVGFPLNLLLFHQLSSGLPAVAPELLGLAANFLAFVIYYYPARRFVVFRVPAAATSS